MAKHLKKLVEQTIVITGATSGIGLVTARSAAQRGARLVLVARSEPALRRLNAELKAVGARVEYVVADVADMQQVQHVSDFAVEKFGGFDTWINNAAVSIYGKIEDVTLEDHRRLFETNYWGVVHGSLVAAEHLKSRGGTIINVGSALSDRAIPIQGTYCASKHAVKGFTDAFRMELEHDGAPITLTLIKPASIDTPYRQHARNYMPMEPKNPPPVYAPEIVAEAILYSAEHAVRELYVGGAGKALAAAAFIAPGLLDRWMDRVMFSAQQEELPSRPPHQGLDHPSGSLLASGGYSGHVSRSSLYTRAAEHPVLTGGLFAAGVGLIFAATRVFKSNGRRELRNSL